MKLQNTLLLFIIAIFLSSFGSVAAHASFTVYEPKVEESIIELESKNEFTADHRDSKDVKRKHILELNYGVNEWWQAGVEGEIEKEKGESYEYTATEFTSLFAFTEPNEYWVDTGVRFAYEFSHESQHADEVKAYLLAKKIIGDFTAVGNIIFGREIGNFRGNDTEIGVAAKVQYFYLPEFSPSIEYYGGSDAVNNLRTYGDQAHRIGPVFNGALGKGWKYETGVLFGISHDAEDAVAKFNFEYEF